MATEFKAANPTGFNWWTAKIADGWTAQSAEEEVAQSAWAPNVDVKETDSAFTIFVELPGIPKEEIDVSLESGILTVSGERTFVKSEQESFRRVERYFGKFNRSFRVPRDVDAANVAASLQDGVLQLDLPKVREPVKNVDSPQEKSFSDEEPSCYGLDSDELNRILRTLSNYWEETEGVENGIHTSLAVLQGFAERLSQRRQVEPKILDFFQRYCLSFQRGAIDPVLIEKEATELGLPVLDPEEVVLEIEASFGIIEAIDENGNARVVLDDSDKRILDDISVPLNWIPRAYREEGAGIAWVERRYGCGVKGRFEPGSVRTGYEESADSPASGRTS